MPGKEEPAEENGLVSCGDDCTCTSSFFSRVSFLPGILFLILGSELGDFVLSSIPNLLIFFYFATRSY